MTDGIALVHRGLLARATSLWRLSWRAGPRLTMATLAVTVIAGLPPAAAAWTTKLVVDGLAGGNPPRALLGPVGALAATGLVAAVLAHVVTYLQGEQNRRVDRATQARLYTAVNAHEGLTRFETPAFLDHVRMAAQATGAALAPATTGIFSVLRDAVALAGLLLTLWLLSPPMAGIVLVAATPVLLAQLALSRRRVSMLAGLTPAMRRQFFYASLITDVDAAKEVRLFGLGSFLTGRMLRELSAVQAGERSVDRRELRVQVSLALLGATVTGAGLVWTVVRAAIGELTLGDVTAFVAALAAAQAAVVGLVGGVVHAHEALLLYGYADTVIRDGEAAGGGEGHGAPVTATPARSAATPGRGIELRDVWFRYDEAHPWVLRGVDITVADGESLALVGHNGSGKSTLVKLLCRLYDPTRGTITWDGVDLRAIPVAELRQRLGVLFQDFVCYDLSAAENIAVGDLTAADDRRRLTEAAGLAGVGDVLAALPRGYDTMLSRMFFLESDRTDADVGVELSLGQWQRVALARTLLRRDARLLILDEPSSGLDPEAEHELHEGLRRRRAGRTSVLISHRLGAVRHADRIVVLSGGRIAESGRHDDLLGRRGVYHRLFTVQANGYRATRGV